MIRHFKNLYSEYDPQFWLMVSGVFISTAGASMIMPFLMIYATDKLDIPLGTAATLLTINAGTSLFSSFLAGSLADKLGRKLVMNISLTLNGIAYLGMPFAVTYPSLAIVMAVLGASNPLYRIGADAMLADLVPSEKRADAYAINRMLNNAGFAIGPAVGGFVAAESYNITFLAGATGMLIYSGLLFFLARETLDKRSRQPELRGVPEVRGGYGQIFRDGKYLAFIGTMSIGLIAPGMLWVLLAVYTKNNFGLPESMFGWIPTTNALMCVFVQYSVTRITRRHPTLSVITVAMLIYAVGVGSVALMSGFWGFWLSMVILTFGELTLVPTASKYVADRAPADLRGRYMSLYWLGWGLSRTAAPLIGGSLNDNLSPHAIWVGGLLIGLASAMGLFLLSRLDLKRESDPQVARA